MSSSYNKQQFETAYNYQWIQNNNLYRFDFTIIDKNDVLGFGKNPLTNDNFDVFVISASAKSYLFDGINKRFKRNVQNFVSNGGGYLGVCGGANAASQGFENPENLFHYRVNQGVFKLANVYINDNFLGEWQYLLKIGFEAFFWDNITEDSYPSYISVNTTVQKNPDNEIFSIYNQKYRDISYAGGPGMYNAYKSNPKLGQVIPLLRYNEEPMYTKPIHYWKKTDGNWEIIGNVTTNLSGTMAGIAATYNDKGRVVLYGPHPEYPYVVINGSIIEYNGMGYPSIYHNFSKYVYNYVGNLLDFSYNIWIIRRSTAWAAYVKNDDLPPIGETSIWLTEPNPHYAKIYINAQKTNRKIITPKPSLFKNIVSVVIGGFKVQAETSLDAKKVEFYVDGDLFYAANEPDSTILGVNYYSADLSESLFGVHTVTVKTYDNQGSMVWADADLYFLNIF